MLDDRDRRILEYLQTDAGISVTELAERVALSVSACSRRIQRLEESGHIARRIVVLDREKMGVPTTVFALIKTAHHADEWIEAFRRASEGEEFPPKPNKEVDLAAWTILQIRGGAA